MRLATFRLRKMRTARLKYHIVQSTIKIKSQLRMLMAVIKRFLSLNSFFAPGVKSVHEKIGTTATVSLTGLWLYLPHLQKYHSAEDQEGLLRTIKMKLTFWIRSE